MTDKIISLDNYKYYIDIVAENKISGWAFKVDDPQHHALIEVRSDDDTLWHAEAKYFREDLVEAGLGSGEYGFTITPSNKKIAQEVSGVDVFIDGLLVKGGFPFSMFPVNPVEEKLERPSYRVYIDFYGVDKVKGWAFKVGHDKHRVNVEIRSDSVVIASGVADDFREDLLEANIGDGAYGFSLTPQLSTFVSTERECKLYVDGELSSVDVFVLKTDQEQIDDALYQEAFSSEIIDFTQSVESKIEALKGEMATAISNEVYSTQFENRELDVIINNIAELSIRIKTIENVLTKHFLNK